MKPGEWERIVQSVNNVFERDDDELVSHEKSSWFEYRYQIAGIVAGLILLIIASY